jgi:predicted nuclease of predicted toxin-antitoxin system
MRFLADENFPIDSVRVLRESGLSVESIQEFAPSNIDEDVLGIAVRSEAILLTFDRDFGTLIYHQALQAPPGVVYFRTPFSNSFEPAQLLLDLIEKYSIDHMFTVLKDHEVRQRRLPSQ